MILHRAYAICLIFGLPLVVVTAPLLAELLVVTLAAMMPRSRRKTPALGLPSVKRLVILVPSHNEELNIGRCVKSLAASAGSDDYILVIAHNCVDGTAENARAAGAMVSVLDNPDLAGKGNALAHGFRIAFKSLGRMRR